MQPSIKRGVLISLLFGCLAAAQAGSAYAEPSTPPPATVQAPKIESIVNQIDDSKFPLVVSYVTALDQNGSPLGGLVASNFEVLEDGSPVSSIETTATINIEQPVAVALVLDISGSMEGKAHDYARQAAISFLDVLGARDTIELISFSTSVKVNVAFTSTKAIIAVGIQNLRTGGDTALYDAITTAIQSLSQLPPQRKVVVLMTDGEDTKSKIGPEEALANVAARRIPVFTVGLGDKVDKNVLDVVARSSGGRAVFAPSPQDLAAAYRSLADQLRGQYAISHSSRLLADGKQHRVVIRTRFGPSAAEGQGVFVARPIPPWIDIVTPKPSQVISRPVSVEVSAKPNASTAKIARLDIVVDGLSIGTLSEPPFSATLNPASLAPGSHTLRATMKDSAGNTASQEVDFAVLRPAPAADPTPSAAPAPARSPEPAPNQGLPVGALISSLAVLGVGSLTVVGLRLRRHRVSNWVTCRHCGTHYSRQSACPTCAVEDRRRLLGRLREVVERVESGKPKE